LIRRRSPRHRRYYQSLNSDLVGVVRAQGGYITGYGGQKVPQLEDAKGRSLAGRSCSETAYRYFR
jgi:hypothetical protein